MYRNAYQRGLLTIFFSGGSKPLNTWDVHTKDGYVSRFLDQEIKSMVLEIGGTNVTTSYIICPKGNVVLGITMPFLVMIVKNLKKYFSFEVTILDETGTRRRFRVSNFQSTTQILPLCTAMPIGLSDGWNQIQFNLAEFTRRAYKKQFVEVQKIKINANIRLRRIYFAERLLPEDELPAEYKLYFPLPSKGMKDKKTATKDKENLQPSAPEPTDKPAEAVPVEEKAASETKIQKPSSKTSVHSVKKAASQTSKKSSKTNIEAIPEGETPKTEGGEEKGPEEAAEAEPAAEPAAEGTEEPAAGATEEPPAEATEGPPAETTEGPPAEAAAEPPAEAAAEPPAEAAAEPPAEAETQEAAPEAPAEAAES